MQGYLIKLDNPDLLIVVKYNLGHVFLFISVLVLASKFAKSAKMILFLQIISMEIQ